MVLDVSVLASRPTQLDILLGTCGFVSAERRSSPFQGVGAKGSFSFAPCCILPTLLAQDEVAGAHALLQVPDLRHGLYASKSICSFLLPRQDTCAN